MCTYTYVYVALHLCDNLKRKLRSECVHAQNFPSITKCPDISYNIELDFYYVHCNFRLLEEKM